VFFILLKKICLYLYFSLFHFFADLSNKFQQNAIQDTLRPAGAEDQRPNLVHLQLWTRCHPALEEVLIVEGVQVSVKTRATQEV
jgi:hypothetical protein